MTDFTPGPWAIRKAKAPTDGAFDYAIAADVGGREQCIAEAFGRVDSEHFTPAEANAKLIAAAPKLYQALKNIIAEIDSDEVSIGSFYCVTLGREAIAEAEGR
jgi:hypothetical protein